jgi:chemotaxis protein MotB
VKRRREQKGVPEWIITYGDLMSLLLTFFILLAAFSELKRPKEYEEVIRSIQEAFGYTGGAGRVPTDTVPANSNVSILEQMAQSSEELKRMLTNQHAVVTGRSPEATVIHREGTRFAAGGALAFAAGSAELTEDARRALLNEVIPKIKGRRYRVEIRGHAWGIEDKASGLDLRDLSYRRARAVERFLIAEGIEPQRLVPMPLGDSEPRTLALDTPRASAENRRVEIFETEVLPDDHHPDPNFTGRP